MILEVTNPKFKMPPQIFAGRRFYVRDLSEIYDGDFVSASSRAMAKGERVDPSFVDRKPHEAPKPSPELEPKPEPRDRPRGSSLWLADEGPDYPLWMIKDVYTGLVMARVRGSLPWIVSQMRLAAHQLGGAEHDLFYQRAS